MNCLALVLLAMMIQTEAGSEPVQGKVAVAYVAVNRAEMSGLPLVSVLRQPKHFALDPRQPVAEETLAIAQAVLDHKVADPTKGADHFYARRVKPWPPWYDEAYITVRIGRHDFLRLGGF